MSSMPESAAAFSRLAAAIALAFCAALAASAASADATGSSRLRGPHERPRQAVRDRATVVPVLPHEHFEAQYEGRRYYFARGVWYRQRGPGFVAVDPPLGLFVPILPPEYTTLWVGGVPYYFADRVYYVNRGPVRGYEVVAAPPDEFVARASAAAAPPPTGSQLFLYPDRGQSPARQRADRSACRAWAMRKTGFDPAIAQTAAVSARSAARRADFDRAIEACLEGRGYTVR